MKSISLAIVGATGVVGQAFLSILEQRATPIHHLVLFASKRSAGQTMLFRGKPYVIQELSEDSIVANPVEYALFSAGGETSLRYAPVFAKQKTIVIDNSSAFRMDPSVPLVVPEVNPKAIQDHHYIIANPNCSTIQAVVVLKPLHDLYALKRVVISTYQAVSGAGSKGIHDLQKQLITGQTETFPYQIINNVLPHIDVFLDNGNTKEEEKVIRELRKIMNLPQARVSATAVRVPVLNCHSESINIEFEQACDLNRIREVLNQAPGVVLYDNPAEKHYPMPLIVDGKDEVYVGRIRRDESLESGINCFVVGDNLRKGAALNAIQILELFIQDKK